MAEVSKKEKKATSSAKVDNKDKAKKEEALSSEDFSGEYKKSIGRRKQAVAQVRLYPQGKGVLMVNNVKASEYFSPDAYSIMVQPLKATGHARDYNFSVIVKGGGNTGQVEAIRLGIARAILLVDPEAKEVLKAHDFLTSDPRQVERKKPGLKKARKAPQWSKR